MLIRDNTLSSLPATMPREVVEAEIDKLFTIVDALGLKFSWGSDGDSGGESIDPAA